MDRKRKRVQVLTLVLCLLLLIVNLWQGKQLERLERRINETQMNIMADIRSMESTVYSQLQEADKLVQNWKIVSAEPDRASRSLRVEVSLSLKEWREDSAAELLWYDENDGGGGGSVPLSGDGTGTFAGRLELPLDGAGTDIGLGLVTRDGGVRRREELGLLGSVSELLPVRCDFQAGRTQAEYMKDVFTVYECGAELYTNSLETEGHVFRIRRNGDVAAEQAAEPGDRLDSYFCGRLSSAVRPGDEMALTFFCRDENGLGYEFLLQSWVAVEERDVAPGSPEWTSWPRLTWD